jgi:hypothetical protein
LIGKDKKGIDFSLILLPFWSMNEIRSSTAIFWEENADACQWLSANSVWIIQISDHSKNSGGFPNLFYKINICLV